MTVPASTNAWNFDLNRAATTGATGTEATQRSMLALKQCLVGVGGVVRRSSNSVVANTSDNWNVYTDCVFLTAGSPHSWIVIEYSFGQICIDWATASGGILTVVYSPGNLFTGGTTTNRPTASDSITIKNNNAWVPSATNVARKWNAAYCPGIGLRVWAYSSGAVQACWVLEQMPSGSPGWTSTLIYRLATAATTNWDMSAWDDLTAFGFVGSVNGTSASASALFEATSGLMSAQIAMTSVNSLDSTLGYVIVPVGLLSNQSGFEGYLGKFTDLYFSGNTPAHGDDNGAAPNKTWIIVGNFWIPNDGSTAQITT